jgi:hypothetical protein
MIILLLEILLLELLVQATGAVNKACLLLIQVNGNKDTNYLAAPAQGL